MTRRSVLLALMVSLTAILGAKAAYSAPEPGAICGAETAHQERLLNIPDRLLHAISLVESGRWDPQRKESFAWPWTVTAEGEGQFLPTKEAAIALVQRLRHEGVTNIDVGCMQVNLQAHPDAFKTLDEAFEPVTNVAYAGRFLNDLHDSTGNWPTAGAYYHSQTPPLAAAYKAKLVATWEAARNRPDNRLDRGTEEAALFDIRTPVGLMLEKPIELDSAAALPAATALAASDLKPLRGQNATSRAAATARTQPAGTLAERAEAKRNADLFRQAKLDEYRKKKLQIAMNKG